MRTLGRHAAHYLGGRVALLLLGFVSFPLFTRLLTVEQYGEIGLVLKAVVCVVVLAKLGAQNAVVRFYEGSSTEDPVATRRFYSSFFFGGVGIALVIATLFDLCVWLAPARLFSPNTRLLLLLASLLVFVRAVWSVLASFFQAERRTVLYNCFDVVIKAATIAAICAALFLWQKTVLAYVSATVAIELLAVAVAAVLLLRRGVLAWDGWNSDFFRAAIVFGLPLAAYEIASVVLDGGDRLLVLRYLGAKQLGYYSAAYNLSSYAQTSLMAPVNLAIVPAYMKLWRERGEAETSAFLARSLDTFLMGAIGLCVAATLISGPMMIALSSAKYASAGRLLPLLIAGLFIYTLHIFFTPGLLIYKKTATLARQVIYATLLNLGLNVVLLPRMGILGGAWATLLAYAFLMMAFARASAKFLPVVVEWRLLAFRLVAALLSFAGIKAVLLLWPGAHGLLTLSLAALASMALYAGLLLPVDPAMRFILRLVWRSGARSSAPRSPSESRETIGA